MKIAFISDIHGNAIALEAVLEDIQKKEVHKIYVLGDLCYRGPDPKRSLELVRSLHTEVIKGNADEWVVRGVRNGEVPDHVVELMNRERDWTVSQLNSADIEFLQGLPTTIHTTVAGVAISAFHATPTSLFEVIPPHTEDEVLQSKVMSAADAQLYVYGHIHKPYIRYMNGKVIMNIGSVGLPFDGHAKASYAIVEIHEGNFSTSIERVEYNVEQVVEQYSNVHYPNKDMMSNILRNGSI